jgi:glycosyltransferase involved in cell wall biosynthesis
MHATGNRTLLFYRNYRSFTGGHLKVRHYYSHAEHSTRFRPQIFLTPDSINDPQNPWHGIAPPPVRSWRPNEAAALFVAGLDWEAVPDPPPVPVINLIQGVRHADEGDPRKVFLARSAIRICSSEEIASAIKSTKNVNGPVHVIPNGIDLGELPSAASTRDISVLIAGMKNPLFARAVQARLGLAGIQAECLVDPLPRETFLHHIARSVVAVTLPLEREGFFLPALEAMAVGSIVVCPDCVGNRGFCRDRETAFRPKYTLDDVVAAAIAATTQAPSAAATMLAAASTEANKHGLAAERLAFLRILDAM